MKPSFILDEADAARGLAASRAEATAQGWNVSIAIVDGGGHLLAFTRLDGAAPFSAAVALDKACTAAVARRESKFYDDAVKGGRLAFLSVRGLVALEGGVPIMVGGQCIGAIGVSGVKSPEDAQIAAAGVRAIQNDG